MQVPGLRVRFPLGLKQRALDLPRPAVAVDGLQRITRSRRTASQVHDHRTRVTPRLQRRADGVDDGRAPLIVAVDPNAPVSAVDPPAVDAPRGDARSIGIKRTGAVRPFQPLDALVHGVHLATHRVFSAKHCRRHAPCDAGGQVKRGKRSTGARQRGSRFR